MITDKDAIDENDESEEVKFEDTSDSEDDDERLEIVQQLPLDLNRFKSLSLHHQYSINLVSSTEKMGSSKNLKL